MKDLLSEMEDLHDRQRENLWGGRVLFDGRYNAGVLEGIRLCTEKLRRRVNGTSWSPKHPELAQGNED